MFKIFTTASVVDRFVASFTSRRETGCDWLDIMSTQDRFYYCGEEDHMERVRKTGDMKDPWFIAQMAGKKFHYCNDYIEEVKRNPERVLDNPDSAFILDVDDAFAKQVEQDYGVICQPEPGSFSSPERFSEMTGTCGNCSAIAFLMRWI